MKCPRNCCFFLLLFFCSCAVIAQHALDEQFGTPKVRKRAVEDSSPALLYSDVKPILDSRCLVCHACYDAPCQVKLSSFEGIERGGSKTEVYEGTRLLAIEPSRLFIDAASPFEWRQKGFHPILNERIQTVEANLEAGLLARMLELKQNNPAPDGSVLPDSFDFRRDRDQVCPNIEEFDDFAKKYPLWGMPYGLPPLEDEELKTLRLWLASGALRSPREPLSKALSERVSAWEQFFNQDTLKAMLMSRYIYEHLFLAHLYFQDAARGGTEDIEYFKLVRSATPPGQPIERIATRRPYEDPGVKKVYYRLWREVSSISEKTHMPYALSPERMQRWRELFLEPEYEVTAMPSYKPKVAANPFRAFQAIPVYSRYNFMLDEAQFTIMGFIKGPVCRGQTALNVIEDRFWVFFVNPEHPKLAHEDDFYAKGQGLLELPTTKGSNTETISTWLEYSYRHKQFQQAKQDLLEKAFPDPKEIGVDIVWDGGNTNKNASLTIFRHFDSATVVRGMVGDTPKTAWLISYGILERLHYLLVAGFDVFGNVGHQLNSRLYMDFLRMESESNFLHLLPSDARKREMHFWYRDAGSDIHKYLEWSHWDSGREVGITYSSKDPKVELFDMLRSHLGGAVDANFSLDNAPAPHRRVFSQLKGRAGAMFQYLPESSFIRVHNERSSIAYTMLKDSGLKNVSSPFFEEDRRVPAEDEVTIAHGVLGAYPNAFFDVPEEKLSDFVLRVRTLRSEAEYRALLDDFGMRRNSPRFWDYSDWLHSTFSRQSAIESGWLDYNRFENR